MTEPIIIHTYSDIIHYGVHKLKIYKIDSLKSDKGNRLIERYDINLKINKIYKKEKYKIFYYQYHFKTLEEAAAFVINIFIKFNKIKNIKTSLFIDTFQNDRHEYVKYYQNCGKIEGKYERYENSYKIDEMEYIDGNLMKWTEYHKNGNIKRIFIPSESEVLYGISNELKYKIDYKDNKIIMYDKIEGQDKTVKNNKVYDLNGAKDLIKKINKKDKSICDMLYTSILHPERPYIFRNEKNNLINSFLDLFRSHNVFGDTFDEYIEYRPGKNIKFDKYFI
jgi:hypothetical protein